MKLAEFKAHLEQVEALDFQLANGSFIPKHFHITELGAISKHFMDCGGTVRNENAVSFQLLEGNDADHRLSPKKLLKIVELAEQTLHLQDFPIEVEYQNGTIGKYGLDFNGQHFLLVPKNTACLAKESCGNPSTMNQNEPACCTADGNCC